MRVYASPGNEVRLVGSCDASGVEMRLPTTDANQQCNAVLIIQTLQRR